MPWGQPRSPGYLGARMPNGGGRVGTISLLVQEGQSPEAQDRKDPLERLAFRTNGDHQSPYISRLAALGSPKQLSYLHPQVHVYHQSRNVGQLTQKAWDKTTDYNETVYTQELGKILSHLRGLDDLNHSTRHKRTPTSLLNPEIILPEAAFRAFQGKNTGWLDEDSWTEGEKVEPYEHDRLQTRVDWCSDPEELVRTNYAVDQKDHESMYLEDYPEDMLDLEETMSTGTSIYD